ncbi:hypothetical protein BDR06DRAFT_126975 [Suillus hirtellus]|nr:hypothetical protein BDR06DRAFT_126975 [Suillus hirtellus]
MVRPKGKSRESRDPTYEQRIQTAIQGITTKVYKTIKEAALANNIPRTTLGERYSGEHKPRREAHVALFGNGRTRARNATSATDNSTTISAAPIEIPPIPALPANSSHYSSREHPNDSNINSPDPRHEIPYNPPVHPTRSNIPASQQFSGHFTSH